MACSLISSHELMQYRPSFSAYHSRRIDVLGYAPRTSFDGFRWGVARFQNVRVRVTADTIGPWFEDYADIGGDGKRSGNWLDLCRSECSVFATLRLLRTNWHQSITRKLHVWNERHCSVTDRSCHIIEFMLNVRCLFVIIVI